MSASEVPDINQSLSDFALGPSRHVWDRCSGALDRAHPVVAILLPSSKWPREAPVGTRHNPGVPRPFRNFGVY
jgi:hypothetical protein